MSNVAEPASGATYKILRELGSRFHSSYAAIREPRELVVLHRFALSGRTRGAGVVEVDSAETLAALVTEADTVAQNWHPNVARVRNVDVYSGEQVAIATELVDGATLDDLTRIAVARSTGSVVDDLPLPVLVRVLLDVLAGLHALHALRDRANRRLGVVHGALAPANIVVGRDGVARLVNVLRPRAARLTPASEALGYAAPELLEGDPLDGRADIYSVGVILWEALVGRRLWAETSPERLRARQRAEEIPPPSAVKTFGLEHLPAVALRALSFDPSRRYRSAADMASDLRKPRDAQIASGAVVALAVAALDGDRIRGRRARLDPASSVARPRPTDAQIEEHLAALDPVESSPDTRSYDSGRNVAPTPPGGMPVALPTVPPPVDDDAWDEAAPVVVTTPVVAVVAKPVAAKRPSVALPSARPVVTARTSERFLPAAKPAPVSTGALRIARNAVPPAPPAAIVVPVAPAPAPILVAAPPPVAIAAPIVDDRMSRLPTRPAAFSVQMPESEGLIPTAAYAPAFPAMPALEFARPVRPSSTSSVVSEVDDDREPTADPTPRRRQRAVAVFAAALLLVFVVIAGIRTLQAPPAPKLTFTTEPVSVTVTSTVAPVRSAAPIETVTIPVPPPTPVEMAPAPAETTPSPPSTPTPVEARPKRYEPMGI